ncbi:hypothetical protein [Actinophytocola algeriensis]|uniref:Uncharacterized protein n=1 Tax=Actinophytocola algeriensis TaxID=1768010 RepID=A0A7W7Q8G8_9PSEU|nr:hypothetical protein [Actinophytocola algeriensis]MBB4908917.1 hypothetical protein [Actinophytocola algeriensis]MBE1474695.1 hypothetical protein [Actinophytocola algeriensis]
MTGPRQSVSSRPAGDVVTVITGWFTELGIDPDERPESVGRRLRLALQERTGGGLASSVYGVRIGTEHDDPEAFIRTALHVLTRQLGPCTTIELVPTTVTCSHGSSTKIGPDSMPPTGS